MGQFEELTFDPNTAGYAVWERPPLVIVDSQDRTGFAGVNQITRIVTTATGGTFTINPNGLGATGSIAGNASASTVQTALEAHASINPGDVVVTGGPLGSAGTPVMIQWTGVFAGEQVTVVLTPSGTTGLAASTTQMALPANPLYLEAFSDQPPAARATWIGAADSEAQVLLGAPLHENRTLTARVRVAEQATMDDALDAIALLVDRLAACAHVEDGLPLQRQAAGSTRQVIYDVLLGEIKEIPLGWTGDEWGWFMNQPVLTLELTCKPYWRAATEILTSTASGSTPVVTITVPDVGGDVPALGRLIVTDTATQARRDVEWGLENRTYDASTSLIVDSDNMATSGFSGTGTTRTGAYDPNASGNNIIRASTVLGTPIAVCGTGTLTHVGTYRVWARCYVARRSQRVRLSWRAGDGRYVSNNWATPPVDVGWVEMDLGTITIPTVLSGTQSWDGRVEAYESDATLTPAALDVDYLRLTPAGEGYGRARAVFSYSPGVVVAYDWFTGASGALNGRTATLGGTWASTLLGVGTTDFQETNDIFYSSQGGPDNTRYGILGSTNFGDTEVTATVNQEGVWVDQGAPAAVASGVIARWTDSNNHAKLWLIRNPGYAGAGQPPVSSLYMQVRVAGSESVLAWTALTPGVYVPAWLRLIIYTSGIAVGQMIEYTSGVVVKTITGFSAALATGGTLATGKSGIVDMNYQYASSVPTRYYDAFSASTPASYAPVIYSGRSMQIRHDDTIRTDSAGTAYGRPQSYRGARLLIPTGDSRLAAVVRRVDLDAAAADQVTDATQLQVAYTERGLVIPRD